MAETHVKLSTVDFVDSPQGSTVIPIQVGGLWFRTNLDGIQASILSNIPAADWETLVGKPALKSVATSGSYADLTGTPILATVATSGKYSDLTDKPTLGSMASQSTANYVSVTLANSTFVPLTAVVQSTGASMSSLMSQDAVTKALAGKVDAVEGLQLSQESFTTAEKDKLASLNNVNLYAGTYASLVALSDATESLDPIAGMFADVDQGAGLPIVRYLWDSTDEAWVAQANAESSLSAEDVMTLYESNDDRNAFTDADQAKLDGIAAQATSNQTDAYLLARENHTGTQPISTITGLESLLSNTLKKYELIQGVTGTENITDNTASLAALLNFLENNYTSLEDYRLTDARDWDAPMVSAGVAEQGTSSTVFKWSPERVRDAIVGWWNERTSGSEGEEGEGTLIFEDTGDSTRTLTRYVEDEVSRTVLKAEIKNNMLVLTLKGDEEVEIIITINTAALRWDEPFNKTVTVTVKNPANRYLKTVAGLEATTGSVETDLGVWDLSAPSVTPNFNEEWEQTLSLVGGVMSSATSGTSGGSATVKLSFTGDDDTEAEDTAQFSVNWATPTLGGSFTAATSVMFLQTVATGSYTNTVNNIINTESVSYSLTPTGGSASGGVFTFTNPIHKDSSGTISLGVQATLTRPAAVSGNQYTATLSRTMTLTKPSFTFPSFWIMKVGTPSSTDIVSGTDFITNSPTFQKLGNNQKALSLSVTNSAGNSQTFWFGVRQAASQPTTFLAGAGTIKAPVVPTEATVGLEPTGGLSGYTPEVYKLYGFTVPANGTVDFEIG